MSAAIGTVQSTESWELFFELVDTVGGELLPSQCSILCRVGWIVLRMLLTESLLNITKALAAELSCRHFQLDTKHESLNLSWRVSQFIAAAQWLGGDSSDPWARSHLSGNHQELTKGKLRCWVCIWCLILLALGLAVARLRLACPLWPWVEGDFPPTIYDKLSQQRNVLLIRHQKTPDSISESLERSWWYTHFWFLWDLTTLWINFMAILTTAHLSMLGAWSIQY